MIKFLLFGLFLPLSAYADSHPYMDEKSIIYRLDNLILVHEHYREGTVENLQWVSYLELIDPTKKEATVFKVKSDLLERIWISPNKNYILGLSNIKINGNKQILVYSIAGKVIASARLSCDFFSSGPTCYEGTVNFVHWFNDNIRVTPVISETENKLDICVQRERCVTIKKTP